MTGSGTLGDPYIISDVDDLQNVELDLAAHYELGQNIDASATAGWHGGAGFVPIGRAAPYFTGSFDGKGYTISNLYMNRDYSDVGLFGHIVGATISNVGLVDCDISVSGDVDSIGALVGYASSTSSTIDNCYCTGSITVSAPQLFGVGGIVGYGINFTIRDSYFNGSIDITGTADSVSYIAGLVGGTSFLSTATLERCYAISVLTVTIPGGQAYDIAGLVGWNAATISQCYSIGSIHISGTGTLVGDVGGLTAYDRGIGTISNSYSRTTIEVDGTFDSVNHIGGFVSSNHSLSAFSNSYSTGLIVVPAGAVEVGGFIGDNSGTITSCFWDTQTSGQATSDGGVGKTTEEMKNIATFSAAGWDIELTTEADPTHGYPFLSWQLGSSPIWLIYGVRRKGNINIDQLIYQHAERMGR